MARHHHDNQISFAMMQPSSSSMHAGSFAITGSKDGAYELGELDQALFMYLDGQDHSTFKEQRQTLNIFPSQPMHVEPSTKVGLSLVSPSSGTSTGATGTKGVFEPHFATLPDAAKGSKPTSVKREDINTRNKGTTSSSEHEGPKTPDPKTLRRLAQNREAARKSRLRKKAYVQQLESSRIKLTQLEQELQRSRPQGGLFLGGGSLMGGDQGLLPGLGVAVSSDAAMFDMEYGRWLEEHHRLMFELRMAVQEHIQEAELRLYVDNVVAHHDELAVLKSAAAKSDVFHILSGAWNTPVERCFIWIGGFRPSNLIKMVVSHIEPLTEQQILGICGMQQSTHEVEETLNQGLEALHQSLSETISGASDAAAHEQLIMISNTPAAAAGYTMAQMAVAMTKLATMEGFLKQADSLRQQTLHRLNQILTTRQAARCFLAMADYFHRLRALSSLWLARPRHEDQ